MKTGKIVQHIKRNTIAGANTQQPDGVVQQVTPTGKRLRLSWGPQDAACFPKSLKPTSADRVRVKPFLADHAEAVPASGSGQAVTVVAGIYTGHNGVTGNFTGQKLEVQLEAIADLPALKVKLRPAIMLRRNGSDGIDGHAPCLGAKKAVAEISTGAFGDWIDDYQLQHEVDVVTRGMSLETLIEKLSTIGNDNP